jgi:hypothetical protein
MHEPLLAHGLAGNTAWPSGQYGLGGPVDRRSTCAVTARSAHAMAWPPTAVGRAEDGECVGQG